MTKTENSAPKVASRLTSRGVIRREQIIDAATEMFLEQGYEAVSVDEIIRVVGGSKTNLYKQFGGKEGLLGEIVAQMCNTFLGSLNQLDISTLRASDGLRVLASTLLRVLLKERHVAFQRLMFAVSGRFPDMTRIWSQSGPERSQQLIAAFIVSRQGAGELREGDPGMLAALFHDMVVSSLLNRCLMGERPSQEEIRRTVDAAVELFINGYAVRT